jgi:hypothetical protein
MAVLFTQTPVAGGLSLGDISNESARGHYQKVSTQKNMEKLDSFSEEWSERRSSAGHAFVHPALEQRQIFL